MSKLKAGEQRVPTTALHEWDENPREIDEVEFERLKRSLKRRPELLKARPLIARTDGAVIAGNMRLRAQIENGANEVDVFVMDVDDQTAFEIATLDNNQFGQWVDSALSALVRDYQQKGGEVDALGFSDSHLAKLLAGDGAGPAPDDAPEDPPLPSEWAVVVTCSGEDQQAELIERLSEEGFDVRALIV